MRKAQLVKACVYRTIEQNGRTSKREACRPWYEILDPANRGAVEAFLLGYTETSDTQMNQTEIRPSTRVCNSCGEVVA